MQPQQKKLQINTTQLPSFIHKDALTHLTALLQEHLTPEHILRVYLGCSIEVTPTSLMFRYNNQLFATYCSNDLVVAVSKCQCGIKDITHDYTYVRSNFWELYFRGHLIQWQFSSHNPIVIEESQHAIS